MARLSPPHPTVPTLPLAMLDAPGDPSALACRWWLETWLVRVRWFVVPLCLAPLLHSPTASRSLTISIAVGLGLGNAAIARLLHREPSAERLRLVYRLTTALEWAVTLGAIALQSHDPTRATLALLLLRLPADGVRYGLPGVARAALGSVVIIATLAAAQVRIFAVLPAAVALRAGLLWAEVVAVMALIVGGLLLVGGRWRRAEAALRRSEREAWLRDEQARLDSEREAWLGQEQARLDGERAALRRLQYGLSEREFEVVGQASNRWLCHQLSWDHLRRHTGQRPSRPRESHRGDARCQFPQHLPMVLRGHLRDARLSGA